MSTEVFKPEEHGGTDPFPVTGKPGNDIDKAIVTLDEKDYQRLVDIEDSVKALFTLALNVKGVVAFGRVKPGFKEPKLVTKLRGLTGMERYIDLSEKKE